MTVSLVGNILSLVGVVGEDIGWGETIDHAAVVRALADVDDGEALTVHLNSPGGECDEGAGIYNALRARKGSTHIIVHGVALSCGSLIAMAGTRISMAAGSIMMIHDVRAGFLGTAADLPKIGRFLETWNTTMASAYALRTGKSKAAIRSLMEAETWFDPAEAVAAKFADDVLDDRPAGRAAAFAYASAFRHPPQHLVTMAAANGWNSRPHSPEPKEPTVSNQNSAPGNPVAQATARIRAIMKHAEAEGRADLAEHLAYETELTAEAAGAILAKAPKNEGNDLTAAAIYETRRGFNPDQERRMNGEGLNGRDGIGHPGRGGASMSAGKVDLVAAMKRRHGVK